MSQVATGGLRPQDAMSLQYAPPDLEEAKRLEAWKAEHRQGLLGTLSAGFGDQYGMVWYRNVLGTQFPDDPTYQLDQAKLDTLSEGLDPDLRAVFAQANSQQHADYLRQVALGTMERRNTLAAAGFGGTAAHIAGSIADPAALAVGVVSGGVGTFALGVRATRVGRLVQAGLVAGVPFAGLEATRMGEEPSIDNVDLFKAGLGGFGMGAAGEAARGLSRLPRALSVGAGASLPVAGFDAAFTQEDADNIAVNATIQFLLGAGTAVIHSPKEYKAFENVIKDAQFRDVAGMPLTPEGKTYFKDQIDAAVSAELAKGTDAQGGGAAYASNPVFANNPPRNPQTKGGWGLDLSNVGDAPQAMSKVAGIPTSFTMGDFVSNSEVSSHRLNSNMLSPDPLLKSDGTPSHISSAEWKKARTNAFVAESDRKWDELYGDYASKNRGTAMDYAAWRKEVTKAVRDPNPNPDPSTQAATQAAAKYFRTILETMKEHRVKGADLVEPDDLYATRVPIRSEIDLKAAYFGEDVLLRVLAKAHMEVSPKTTPEIAAKLANVLRKVWGTVHDGTDVQRGRILNPDQREKLIEALQKEGLTPAQIEDFTFQFSGKAEEKAGVITRLQHRVPLNEKYFEDIYDANGTFLGRLSVEDLFENDISVLMRIAANQGFGASAMAEVYRRNSIDGHAPIDTFDAWIAKLKKDARDMGRVAPNGDILPGDAANIAKLELMGKMVAGIPIRDHTATTIAANVLNNMQVFRLLSNVGTGIQNAGEIVQSISEKGLRATYAAIPEVPSIIGNIISGKVDDSILREIELLGIGVDHVVHQYRPNATMEDGVRVGLQKIEVQSARMARIGTNLSGISYTQTAISKLSADMIMNDWAWRSVDGKAPSLRRVKSLGFKDQADFQSVLTEMKKPGNSIIEKGAFGSYKMIRLNMDNWNPAIASKFRVAVLKEAGRLTLAGNAASNAKWMTTPIGKLIASLRTFAFGSWRNKMLFELQMRDRIAGQNVVLMTATGALLYAARIYAESQVDDDPEKYRRKYLSPEKVAAASFSRAAWSSMVPTAVDTVVHDFMRYDPIFSPSRSTNLAGGTVFGNPTFDWAGAAMRAVGGAVRAPFSREYHWSQDDVRNWMKLGFVPQVIGLYKAVDSIGEAFGLPKKSLPPKLNYDR